MDKEQTPKKTGDVAAEEKLKKWLRDTGLEKQGQDEKKETKS